MIFRDQIFCKQWHLFSKFQGLTKSSKSYISSSYFLSQDRCLLSFFLRHGEYWAILIGNCHIIKLKVDSFSLYNERVHEAKMTTGIESPETQGILFFWMNCTVSMLNHLIWNAFCTLSCIWSREGQWGGWEGTKATQIGGKIWPQ